MKAWLMALAMAVSALCAPIAAHADNQRRVALVIANGDYIHAGSLKNPVSDARLVSGALKSAGFQIVSADPNLGIAGFRDALRRFRTDAVGSQVALIYYAGHGIEARGKNWLIPTDATLQQDADLDYEAIDLDLVLSATEGAGLRVVILDACRNNPFGHAWKHANRAAEAGLAQVDVDDVLVIYSAGPGQTAMDGRGDNSPFAEALAKRLPQPGLAIQLLGGMVRDDVLRATGEKQRPYISASITGTPFMLMPGAGATVGSAPATALANDPRAVEMMFWQSAAESNDAGQLNAYLRRYPNGNFAELAKARIVALNREAREDMTARSPTVSSAPSDPRAVEMAMWNSVSASNDAAQLNAYLNEYPKGSFAAVARAKVEALKRAAPPPINAASASPATATPRWTPSPYIADGQGGGRMGGSDDYVCNHGAPDDPRTVQACARLRGTPETQGEPQ